MYNFYFEGQQYQFLVRVPLFTFQWVFAGKLTSYMQTTDDSCNLLVTKAVRRFSVQYQLCDPFHLW